VGLKDRLKTGEHLLSFKATVDEGSSY
jgi:hypothetical protein